MDMSGGVIKSGNESFDSFPEEFYGSSSEGTSMGTFLSTLPVCQNSSSHSSSNSMDIELVKYYTYGFLMPTICSLGIIGNLLNLIVLSQPNMKGTAYIYMRGYAAASLMAIILAIPFSVRVLIHNDSGRWTNIIQAFYHTYLELYIGNACLGMGVMMLVALTMERFFAVCHPEKSLRSLQGSKKAYFIIASIPIATLSVYTPHLLRSSIVHCLSPAGILVYQKMLNREFMSSIYYKIYTWFLALVFRLLPTLLLAYLNLRIIIAYRRTCAKRRIMTGKTSRDDKKFAEESRIMLLLGSTSVLFFVCVTPMVVLSVMLKEPLLKSFSFQVFRACANALEVTNYSLTFYIYCLFSREFRNTFLGLFKTSPSANGGVGGKKGARDFADGKNGPKRGSKSSGASKDQVKGRGSTPLLAPPTMSNATTTNVSNPNTLSSNTNTNKQSDNSAITSTNDE